VTQIRELRLAAHCALMAILVSSSAALAQQSDSRGPATQKPANTQSANKSSTQSHSAKSRTAPDAASHTPAGHAKLHSTKTASNSVGTAHPTSSKASTTRTAANRKGSVAHKKPTRVRGQQKIDPDRAQAIQQALIREHYLSPDAAGPWNQASEDAMRRYQEDHGWQTKEVPDSRALIKLGLGPSKDGLLNPESAMTTMPEAPKAESTPPTSNSADPSSATSSPNH
jgi:hypothetical protein